MIVATFGIGRTEWNVPLLVLSIVVVAFLLKALWAKLQSSPYEGTRDMRLVEIPKDEDEEEEGEEGAAAESDVKPESPAVDR